MTPFPSLINHVNLVMGGRRKHRPSCLGFVVATQQPRFGSRIQLLAQRWRWWRRLFGARFDLLSMSGNRKGARYHEESQRYGPFGMPMIARNLCLQKPQHRPAGMPFWI